MKLIVRRDNYEKEKVQFHFYDAKTGYFMFSCHEDWLDDPELYQSVRAKVDRDGEAELYLVWGNELKEADA